jgi:hypothetical protein
MLVNMESVNERVVTAGTSWPLLLLLASGGVGAGKCSYDRYHTATTLVFPATI